MELRIHGQVTACICRTTTDGRPLLEVELKTPDGQAVHARHIYPDNTAASSHAAMTLARQLKGQQAELYTTNRVSPGSAWTAWRSTSAPRPRPALARISHETRPDLHRSRQRLRHTQ